ncbi:MAG TPA: 2'-5' RNA ligase family protein [Burkholderiales bacterium]|nr:2'-5' RNA ligase family protein [Burkholderiales bacterium]
MSQSALIVEVPEVERFIAPIRERHDPSAQLGVPAHITVLFPFLAATEFNESAFVALADVAGSTISFQFHLVSVGRFPDVVYLGPKPTQPFAGLSRAVRVAFPGHEPYGGRYTSFIPHLTVAHGEPSMHGSVAAHLQALMDDIAQIQCTCHTLVLIENSSGRWRTLRSFTLKS